jgi:drug/metabolite transporter (DMT)-like permease
VFGFALPFLRADWRTIRAHAAILVLLSLTGISAYNTLTYYGLQYTEAINGMLLQSCGPLLVAGWAFLLFSERLGVRQLAGLIVALVGIVIIICRGDVAALLHLHFNAGDLYLVAAIASYALYSALLKKKPDIHPLSFVTVTMGTGAILLVPVWAAEASSGYSLALDATTVFAVLYVIVFPSILSHFFFYRGVELIGPNRAAPFMYLIPIFGSVLAMVFLGERVRLFHLIAFALVVVGILLATWHRSAANDPVKT